MGNCNKKERIKNFNKGKYYPNISSPLKDCWFIFNDYSERSNKAHVEFLDDQIVKLITVTVLNSKKEELSLYGENKLFNSWKYLLIAYHNNRFTVHRHNNSFIIKSSKDDTEFRINKKTFIENETPTKGLINVSADGKNDTFLRISHNNIDIFATETDLERYACISLFLYVILQIQLTDLKNIWIFNTPFTKLDNPLKRARVTNTWLIWKVIDNYYGEKKANLRGSFEKRKFRSILKKLLAATGFIITITAGLKQLLS